MVALLKKTRGWINGDQVRTNKPISLWLFQAIALVCLVTHGVAFFRFTQIAFSEVNLGVLAGMVLNLGAVLLLVYAQIGIERKKPKAWLVAGLYSGLILIAVLFAVVQSYEKIRPEELGHRLVTIGIYTVIVVLVASLVFSISRGKKVQAYFSASQK